MFAQLRSAGHISFFVYFCPLGFICSAQLWSGLSIGNSPSPCVLLVFCGWFIFAQLRSTGHIYLRDKWQPTTVNMFIWLRRFTFTWNDNNIQRQQNNNQYTPCSSSVKEIHLANDATGRFCKIYSHKFLHVVFAQQEHKHNCLDKHACASHVTP